MCELFDILDIFIINPLNFYFMSVKGNTSKELRSANSAENLKIPETIFDCHPEGCSVCDIYCFWNPVLKDSCP